MRCLLIKNERSQDLICTAGSGSMLCLRELREPHVVAHCELGKPLYCKHPTQAFAEIRNAERK